MQSAQLLLEKRTNLFFGDADEGERSAIIYSIIESCRRHGIEPYTYLHNASAAVAFHDQSPD
jgi:hypothetical protein